MGRWLPHGPRGRGLSRRALVAAVFACIIVALLAGFPVDGVRGASPPDAPSGGSGEVLEVHFIDVGQGDATLLRHGETVILVDAGRHDRDDVMPYLRSVGVDHIDLLIATHPHADHIGQMPRVLKELPVREVWMTGHVHTSRVFERAVDAIVESGAGYHEPRAGERVDLGGLRLEVLHPRELTGDFNEDSIVMRVQFGQVAFLLTGDAGAAAEGAMLRSDAVLTAHVLHVGHHGSRTSTTASFLDAVSPEVAVYSAGAGNSYGHPHPEVVERLRRRGVAVYGTDTHGTVIVTADGTRYRVAWLGGGSVPAGSLSDRRESGGAGCAPGQIDINAAPEDELVRIVHIGPSRARQIVSLRPFRSVADLERVQGIGPGRLKDIEEEGLACVG